MTTPHHTLQIPTIESFTAKYYFAQGAPTRPAKFFPPHLHDVLEIYVLLEGDASFMVEDNLYQLESGDAIIAKPNEIHNCILNTESKHEHLCFWLEPNSEFLFADFLQHDFGQNNLISPTKEEKERLLVIYSSLREATLKKDQRRQFYLFLEMLDIFSKNIVERVPTTPIPTVLQEILTDLNKNFLHVKNLEYFSEKFFISQSTLNRLFRTYLRTTPKLYLEAKQLAYSRRLLKKGHSVLSACMESGFTDCSNYIRLFKKRFGITPKQYREGN